VLVDERRAHLNGSWSYWRASLGAGEPFKTFWAS